MCFSAAASFTAAAVTGSIGIAALIRAPQRQDLLLAATPLLFALHQGIEGLLWLELAHGPGQPLAGGLTVLFLLIAEAFWPVYAPLAILLIEPDRLRRRLIRGCLVIGLCTGAVLAWWVLARPHAAAIVGGHIAYLSEERDSRAIALAYLVATVLPLFLSSHRTAPTLGTIILAGYVVTYLFYREAFVSVWCFFAAAASVAILGHFEWSRRQRLRAALS